MLYTNYCNYNFSNPDRDIIDRPQGIQEYLFLYFQTTMEIWLKGGKTIAKPGACILIPAHTGMHYQAVKQFRNSFVHFSGEEIEQVLERFPNIPRNELFYLPDIHAVNLILKDIFSEYISKDLLYEERIDNLLQGLLIMISRQMGKTLKVSREEFSLYGTFQKARQQILTHPERPWTVENMAELTHLGSSQFYHYYREFFASSPKAELLQARIQRAQYLLLHESFTVAMVAEYCGFTNLSHFTRYFKKSCGVSPGVYGRKATIGTEEKEII